ncbi:MAG: site-specific DNA-methyltransferase [Candidatus Omnitrophica bacterium]|nr:site-specific DNA-methyltransferase [Candidatus Omnitrophota bacterium]
MKQKPRAGLNRTLFLTKTETKKFRSRLIHASQPVASEQILNKTILQDMIEAVPNLPDQFVDLLFLDPPYNLPKRFNETFFKKKKLKDYTSWMCEWLAPMMRLLKPTASVYICCDWKCSQAVFEAAQQFFKIRSRITWEREKGRGALRNWKNSMEDIWFCTVSKKYTFNVNDVKLKRRVIAPYTHTNGEPKDWEKSRDGNYRLTHPSNLWTDITIPFWSMPENTDHPTQKPEKLLAKLILASTHPGDVVLDPFLGTGAASVTAKKLGRQYVGIEIDEYYCCLAEKRLEIAESNRVIQGYHDGVFWERNSFPRPQREE